MRTTSTGLSHSPLQRPSPECEKGFLHGRSRSRRFPSGTFLTMFQIPAGTRHKIANAAGETARLAVFFDRPSHTVTFDEPLMPMDDTVLGD
jgi:hypothetical protein